MHVVITDSGVGGLSVCAYAERSVRIDGTTDRVRLTFANAAPANDYGYNSMATHAEKVETFDRFLRRVNERFRPDQIYVACNTLSVLMHETPFATQKIAPLKGIVTTGAALLQRELQRDPSRTAIIFGTKTTIDAGTYPRMLAGRGIASPRVVSQACPGLADTISEDREGSKTRAEIDHWVRTALGKATNGSARVVALLACTHYGYRRNEFAQSFADANVDAIVIDPNERAAGDIFQDSSGPHHEADVAFITRYAIPAPTIEALTFFLATISPKTVEAMRNFEHDPGLF
jgi:glutamate racemase